MATHASEDLTWHFRREPDDGCREFGDPAGFAFKGGFTTVARECGQNAIDAREDGSPTARLEFTAIHLDGRRLLDFLTAIRWDEQLLPRLQHASTNAERAKAAQSIAPGLKALEKGSLTLLRVSDFGTTGLIGPEFSKFGPSKFCAVMRNKLDCEKGETAGGGYGLGKSTMWAASRFGIVLSGAHLSEPLDGRSSHRVFGRANLPWHEFEGSAFEGPGWFGTWDPGERCTVSSWGNRTVAETLFLDRPDGQAGTSFVIVGAYDSVDEATDVKAIAEALKVGAASSFWPAMVTAGTVKASLEVRVKVMENDRVVLEQDVSPADHRKHHVAMLEKYYLDETRDTLDEPGDIVIREVDLEIPKRGVGDHQHKAFTHRAVLIVSAADDDFDTDDGSEPVNEVAFLRGAKMIVMSKTVGGLHVGTRPFRAVVLAGDAAASDQDATRAERFLNAAEPPAHNNWEQTPKVTSTYGRGTSAFLERFITRVRSAIKEVVKPSEVYEPDGPEALRELLKVTTAPPPKKLPKVDRVSGTLQADGSWLVEARVKIPPPSRGTKAPSWTITPVVKFASQSGASVKVDWEEIEALDKCVVTDAFELRSTPGAQTVKFSGHTKPTSQPVGGQYATITVAIRKAEVAK